MNSTIIYIYIYIVKSFCEIYLKNLIYPNHIKCIFCGEELTENSIFDTCMDCYNSLPFITHACLRCGDQISENNDGVCLTCHRQNYFFNQARSTFMFQDEVLYLVHKIKYNSKNYSINALAHYLSQTYATTKWNIDYITYVPLHKDKEKLRGFNQSQLLAEELSKIINVPCLNLCFKVVNNTSQTTLNHEDRRKNVLDNFKFNSEYSKTIKDKNILIIDDIFTTGATTNEISKILKNHHIKDCYVLTIAHTVLSNSK